MEPKLPVYNILENLKNSFLRKDIVILKAPPGSGKTTIIPIELIHEPWTNNRKILVLEPRRLAARNSALRVSQIINKTIGNPVGYRTRNDSIVTKDTTIEYITEGIFLKILQNNPELSDTALVIFDEFHERNLETDLSLALLLETKKLFRNDLKLLLMSATLDEKKMMENFKNADFLSADGFLYPVEIEYLKESPNKIPETIASLIPKIEHKGDILVFLSGVHEIKLTYNLLNQLNLTSTTILMLYGDLTYEDQKKVFISSAGKRKIILSTNIAETSLTIEGIKIVIDSGYRKNLIYDPSTGMNKLVTQRIALDSAEQRKGRAGRTSEGKCYRLWTKYEEKDFTLVTKPDIQHSDLSYLLLILKNIGLDANNLFWLDPPNPISLQKALDLLKDLDALDSNGIITDLGRKIIELPLSPRLGAMILKSITFNVGDSAIKLAIYLNEKIYKLSNIPTNISDIFDYLNSDKFKYLSSFQLFKSSYNEILNILGPQSNNGTLSVGGILSLGFPDRIGKNRNKNHEKFKLSNGKGAYTSKEDSLCNYEYIVVPEIESGNVDAKIYLAAKIDLFEILKLFQNKIDIKDNISYLSGDKFKILSQKKYKELIISESEILNPDSSIIQKAILSHLINTKSEDLDWNENVLHFIGKINLIHSLTNKYLSFNISTLKENPDWLEPYLNNIDRISDLKKIDILSILKSNFSYEDQKEIEKEAPDFFISPAGNRIKIFYSENEIIIKIKLQELFGMTVNPKLLFGTIFPTFYLLSPAGRPIQITKDLLSFWKNTYPEVKKELKGRYPRHPWPDNPLTAVPSSKTKPRNH